MKNKTISNTRRPVAVFAIQAFAMAVICWGWASPAAALNAGDTQPGTELPSGLPWPTTESVCPAIWLVDTRQCIEMACTQDVGRCKFSVSRNAGCQWQPANQDQFLADGHPNIHTVIFVHGNQASPADAIRLGCMLYRQFLANGQTRPFRLVIWSWPSERISGRLRDLRVKADRSEDFAFLLANFMSASPPEERLTLVGYSYGARMIAASLHLICGGCLKGRRNSGLASEYVPTKQYQAAFMAAALNDDWMLPGCRLGESLCSVDCLLNLHNTSDPALKRYHLLAQDPSASALGYTGFPRQAGDCQVWETDAAPYIGKTHGLEDYLRSEPLMRRLREFTFSEAPCAAKAP